MKFSQIIAQLNLSPTNQNNQPNHSLVNLPDLDPEIRAIANIETAEPGNISYIEGGKFANYLTETQASALILPADPLLQEKATARGIAWLSASDPRLLFAQVISVFYQPYQPTRQIHATAVIDPSATIGRDVYIGAYAVIEAGVTIGDQVCIHPHVVIYPQATIGDRTVLHSHCTIHERSQIGNDCVIHSGTVIGAEGFGFVPTAQGWVKMQQSGYTVLADRVEVGCNSNIDRPAVGETKIGKNTKIDNLVQIGHGCQVGENCALAAQVGLAGGVKVGNNVILAGQVGISNQTVIGDGAIATAKTGIHHNVAPGEIVSGSPAVSHKIFLKGTAIYSRLPEMYQSLKEIKKYLQIK
jgi:UDP-3-O-[3-hydroxymyristoyl] glucosamine N-acyltransferase